MQKEQKEYVFKFQGTKESFLNALSQFPNTGDGFYYFHDYIIKVEAEQIQFGIERAGHSGGYWFIPLLPKSVTALNSRDRSNISVRRMTAVRSRKQSIQ